MNEEDIKSRFNELAIQLESQLKPEGFWEGRLSSSALAVSVAIAALHFDGFSENSSEIKNGLDWLRENINADGSYGDTPESPGNVSTSLLAFSALNLFAGRFEEVRQIQLKVADYLATRGIDINSSQVAGAILSFYKRDYTFSVPILTMCGLCGVPGKDAFKHIPQLPFELSLLPRRIYRLLNLSVVSYAMPALIAVGIVIFKNKKPDRFRNVIRRFSVKGAMNILHRIMPESGGFLEAIPLTAFVCLSLINSGFKETDVVRKGIGFLKKTQREDGSWPIDVNLSTWVTTLSVKAFRSELQQVFTPARISGIAEHLKQIRNKKVHIFNGADPGGWGWTYWPGSVPDGDDTPGAILALMKLQEAGKVKNEVLAACKWLSRLQNSNGGFPTFSKGWGKLPFDRSCCDLTGHCLLAVSSCLEAYGSGIGIKAQRNLRKTFGKALYFLEQNQSETGYWLPLWFGNQNTAGHTNPVYGTAKVLSYLKDAVVHSWQDIKDKERITALIKKATGFLLDVQNRDGSWGGDKNIPGTIEETALAVSALVSDDNTNVCNSGLNWLDNSYTGKGLQAAPIGLYFASLWYDEKMYPLTAYLEALARTMEAGSGVSAE